MKLVSIVEALFFGSIVAACGSSGSAGAPSPGTTIEEGPKPPAPVDMPAPNPDKADAGSSPEMPPADAGMYPAFKPDIGQIVNNGGAILTAAKIVTVTWAGDPNAAALETFADEIGSSDYWSKSVGEYGIGKTTSDASLHVRVQTPAPTTITDTAMETYIADQLKSPAKSQWPAPDENTIYIVYVPESTHVTSDGQDACISYDAYHSEMQVGTNPSVAFAIILEGCHDTQDLLEYSTQSASHEIAEAATDPHPMSDGAYEGFDADHLSWEIFQDSQDENADACQDYDDSYYTPGPSFPYSVQRLWSNASAAAGHNPCIPAVLGAYYNVTPLDSETISVNLTSHGSKSTTKGFRVSVGQTKSFKVGFYSDAPVDGGWWLSAVEGDDVTPPAQSHVTITIDKPNANNGAIANVSVTVTSAPPSGNAILITLVSQRAGEQTHYMPLLIGAY